MVWKLERDFLQGHGVIGQGVMALNWKMADLHIRKKFFPLRVERPWPRLPREAVAAPSLAGLKARLDGAGSTLGWWKGSLSVAGEWNWMIYKVPSSPDHSRSLWSGEAVPSRCCDYLKILQKLDAEFASNASTCSKCGLCHSFRNFKTPQELKFLHEEVWFLHKCLNLTSLWPKIAPKKATILVYK